ncbi:MAG TPA: DinB family protein [Gemmatimonadaceae bacterium]|nr:DinB family protein [Gemmatimonadaceae bacterium]
MTIRQMQQAKDLIAALKAVSARAMEIDETVDPTVLDRQPAPDAWSAAQVFDHLCVANDSYVEVVRPVVERAVVGAHGGIASATWRPSVVGRLLARSMTSERKLPAPKQWRPAPDARPNVIGEFLARQGEIEALIERSGSVEWRRMRMSSPISALIRMNVGDAFTILVRHEERHFRQIERTIVTAQGTNGALAKQTAG